VQTGRKLLGRILRSRLPLRVKMEAFVHLTNNLSYALMLLLALLIVPAMLLRTTTSLRMVLFVDMPLFFGATLSVLIFYLASQAAAGIGWRKQLRYLPTLMGVGIGLSVNNARAVLSGLFQRGGTFHRTPKYKIEKRGEDWLGKRYRAGWSSSVLIELALAFYFGACTLYAAKQGMWLSVPFLYLFVQGYAYMAALSLVPALAGMRGRHSEEADLGSVSPRLQ
jgi:hypothetical protein